MDTFVTCKTVMPAKHIRPSLLKAIALGISPAFLVLGSFEPAQAQLVSDTSTSAVVEDAPSSALSAKTRSDSFPQLASLTILNPSFEEDFVGGDGASDFITGWQVFGSSPWSAGVYRPSTGAYAQTVPNGVNVAYANTGGSIFQRLADPLAANTVYKLGVYVGSRPPFGFSGYTIELLAGETVLATATDPKPDSGSFLYVETTPYTATAGNPYLGQPLGIRLSSGGVQINFDSVSLLALSLNSPRSAQTSLEANEAPSETATPTQQETVASSTDSLPRREGVGRDYNPFANLTGSSFRLLAATADSSSEVTIASTTDESTPTSVPEPTSLLGVLAFGALSLRSLAKQKQKGFRSFASRG